jgi:transposase InsO family protein
MVRPQRSPSPTWRAFLKNHLKDIVATDFFIVPTIRNQILFVFVILAHHRRRVLHFNVTTNPTARWTAQQIVEAFPWETPPKYLLRDRDKIYGKAFQKRVKAMSFQEVLIAPRSPWQNPIVERLIGFMRRECLDHVIVLNERHLRRVLRGYLEYYHRWRTHQSLEMDSPDHRDRQLAGKVVSLPHLGGLHHHYERRAA